MAEERERGTIVSWRSGVGSIAARNGDILQLSYWSVVQGFRELRPGQQVEFSRGAGMRRNIADLVVVLSPDFHP
jgi:cold shock CspA family protein